MERGRKWKFDGNPIQSRVNYTLICLIGKIRLNKESSEIMRDVMTICCYCGCGCGMYLRVENERVVGASPSRSHPVSQNNLCVKGWRVHEFIHDRERLTEPLLRKGSELVPVSWDEALDAAASGLSRVRESHGPDALGVLASAKCSNEENFLLQKFTRAVLGTNNIDHCARL